MRIDLHCHTKRSKKGDGKGRSVTTELFKQKIELADIKIVAITNHNIFDYDQYRELSEAVKDSCQVWPGVELDVVGENRFHLIVVTEPDSAEDFAKSVSSLFEEGDINNSEINIEEVMNAFDKYEAIYISHYHDKNPAITEGDKEKLAKLVNDNNKVFIEPRNMRTLGILANKDMNVLIGSDVQEWSCYEKCTFADLRLPVANFAQFLMLTRKDSAVVKTMLGQKEPITIIGKPHETADVPLMIYPDVNIIFGQKGTGKTEIIKSLYSDMIKAGKKCVKYIATENQDDFESQLSIHDMEQDLEKVGAEGCESEFRILEGWADSNPVPITCYINWQKTKDNSNNKARMRITEAITSDYLPNEKYDTHKKDKVKISKIYSDIKGMALPEYMTKEQAKELLDIVGTLRKNVFEKRKNDFIDEKAMYLTNFTIDRIKMLADKSSDTVSRPSTTGFSSFARNRMKLIHATSMIKDNLNKGEYNEKVLIGTLEGKGNIYVNSKYRMLCKDERTANYPGKKITELLKIKESIEKIEKNFFVDGIATEIDLLKNYCIESGVHSTKSFIGLSKQIVTSDGKKYNPSNGEKGILLLQHVLKEEADAYFLDEPELGMGNSYIDTDIRPIISGLAKRRKFVIVATHNANIAVRTLPYMSIFRTHEDGEYKTYIGNPFDDRLVNINDTNDIKSWTEESLRSLEGGEEAFYERSAIYESRSN